MSVGTIEFDNLSRDTIPCQWQIKVIFLQRLSDNKQLTTSLQGYGDALFELAEFDLAKFKSA